MELEDLKEEKRKRKHADWKHVYIQKRIDAGLCRQCGEIPPIQEQRYCKECKIKVKKWTEDWKKRTGYNYSKKIHLQALLKVAQNKSLKCCNCGCDNLAILEINHIKGKGYQEYKTSTKYKTSSNTFYKTLISGKRTLKDLDIRCKVCNIIHYCEMNNKGRWKVKYVRNS